MSLGVSRAKRASVSIAALLSLVAIAGPSAKAATIGAWSGEPNGGVTVEPCYSEGGFDAVENNGTCGSAGSWEVPLYVDAPGLYFASVSVTCSEPVTCATYGVSPTGGEQSEAFANVPANTSGNYRLGGVAGVPDGGYLFAACWLPAKCTLHSVDWEVESCANTTCGAGTFCVDGNPPTCVNPCSGVICPNNGLCTADSAYFYTCSS